MPDCKMDMTWHVCRVSHAAGLCGGSERIAAGSAASKWGQACSTIKIVAAIIAISDCISRRGCVSKTHNQCNEVPASICIGICHAKAFVIAERTRKGAMQSIVGGNPACSGRIR